MNNIFILWIGLQPLAIDGQWVWQKYSQFNDYETCYAMADTDNQLRNVNDMHWYICLPNDYDPNQL